MMQGVAKKDGRGVVKGRGKERTGRDWLPPTFLPALPRAATGYSFCACVPWPFARGFPQLISPELGKAKF